MQPRAPVQLLELLQQRRQQKQPQQLLKDRQSLQREKAESRCSSYAQNVSGKYKWSRHGNHHGGWSQRPPQLQQHQEQPLSITKGFQHYTVPKNHNLAKEFPQASLEQPPTTLMIRNIPNRYTQHELIKELESVGFMGSFDFFYAPMDTGTMGNVGYAFVNFCSPAWAALCQQVLEGYAFRSHQQRSRRKVATVSVAHIQGLEANMRHYENTAVSTRMRLTPVIRQDNQARAPYCSM